LGERFLYIYIFIWTTQLTILTLLFYVSPYLVLRGELQVCETVPQLGGARPSIYPALQNCYHPADLTEVGVRIEDEKEEGLQVYDWMVVIPYYLNCFYHLNLLIRVVREERRGVEVFGPQ
jgi:hypothetical protein